MQFIHLHTVCGFTTDVSIDKVHFYFEYQGDMWQIEIIAKDLVENKF